MPRKSIAPFRVVVADPPWPFSDKLPGAGRGATKHYNLSPVDDICRAQLPPLADDALLFLWRVEAMPEEATRVCRAWGFVPKSGITWVKTKNEAATVRVGDGDGLSFGMGHYVRAAHESCLVGARGRAASLIRDHAVRSVFFAPREHHSKKPDIFYDLVERLAAGPYLELYARASRAGWTSIGKDLGSILAAARAE